MYLSKVELSPRWIRDPYQWHRVLWQLFPNRPGASREFLFRVEGRVPDNVYVLLQSETAPSAYPDGVKVLATKHFLPVLKAGQALRFHLIANPVKTIRDAHGRMNRRDEPKACRVPLIREDQQQRWLSHKLSGAADIDHIQAGSRPPLYFRRQGTAGKIAPVAFDGILVVRDPVQMLVLLRKGIGPAKSFGCGLLSLARA